MPPKGRQPASSGKSGSSSRKKKNKQGTQKPPQQRVKVLGADGKISWIWRDWGS